MCGERPAISTREKRRTHVRRTSLDRPGRPPILFGSEGLIEAMHKPALAPVGVVSMDDAQRNGPVEFAARCSDSVCGLFRLLCADRLPCKTNCGTSACFYCFVAGATGSILSHSLLGRSRDWQVTLPVVPERERPF